MEDEKIRVVKQLLEPKLVRDIQVFFGFTNFYWQFIQGFSCIAPLLTSMLKTIKNTGYAANHKEIKGKVSSNSIVGNSMIGGGETINKANFTKGKNQVEITKSKILVKSKNHDFSLNSRNKKAGTGFLTPKAKLAFI